jgi:hypothetical protein
MQIDRESNSLKGNFTKLTFQDIPHISGLLMSVWPKLYGDLGHPLFSSDYLQWVYGGPHQDKHILIGAWMDNSLVAYQGFLHRTISYCGRPLNAYLNTHAAISPLLPYDLRMNCGFQLIKQHILFDHESQFYADDCDLVYAFYDAEKSTAAILDRQLKKNFGIQRKTVASFNQFVVMPNKLEKYLEEMSAKQGDFEVRLSTEEDVPQLTALFNQIPEGPHFTRQVTENELRHHLFGHADHQTHVIEQDGALKALINFYPLETVKENSTSTHILIEYLIADSLKTEYTACLLREAVRFGKRIGAKSAVFENANYLDYSLNRPMGLMPTLRKMTMSVMSKNGIFDYSGPFRCDVK